ARDGRGSATRWYARQVAHFAVRLMWERVIGLPTVVASMLLSVYRDTRLGVRSLVRHPGYTLASVLTLGVGIGAVACVYSAANWVLLRPVPGVSADDALATLQLELRDDVPFAFPMSNPDLRDVESGIGSL